jgi:hypothetical protein
LKLLYEEQHAYMSVAFEPTKSLNCPNMKATP